MRGHILPPSEMKSLYGSTTKSAVSCLSYVTFAMVSPYRRLSFIHQNSKSMQCLSPLRPTSLRELEKRFAFFDDISRKLRRIDPSGILCRVDCSIRNEKDVASLERHRRLPLDFIF